MSDRETRRYTTAEREPVRFSSGDVPRPDADDVDDDEEIIVASPPPPRLEIGRLIEGRLRIVRLLGRGGMSEVYEAYDERARRTVAIKLLLTSENVDAQLAIFAEARALVGFSHPHVLKLHGVGAIESQPFVELESASGGSLADRVHTDGALPVAEALDITIAVADGLAALHAAGTVHRDVKADNVLLTAEGRPVIADFGLAMHTNDLPALPTGIVGTPAYMAPEAILGLTESFEQYASADQYGLAVTAYYALTGSLPFDGATPSALFYAQMAVEPDAPSQRREGLPTGLDAVLRRALAKRPQDRYATMADFRDALRAIRAEFKAPPEPPRPVRDSGVRGNSAPALKPTVVAA